MLFVRFCLGLVGVKSVLRSTVILQALVYLFHGLLEFLGSLLIADIGRLVFFQNVSRQLLVFLLQLVLLGDEVLNLRNLLFQRLLHFVDLGGLRLHQLLVLRFLLHFKTLRLFRKLFVNFFIFLGQLRSFLFELGGKAGFLHRQRVCLSFVLVHFLFEC